MPAKARLAKGDMVDNTGIGLLLLVRRRNIDEVDHRLAFAVHPRAGKRKIRPVAVLQPQDLLVEPDRIGELSGPDVQMIEDAYPHPMSLPFFLLPFVLKSSPGHSSTKPRPPAKRRRCPSCGS